MELRPEGCKVLVEVAKVPERVGRIIVPATYAKQHQHVATIGTVVAIGPGAMCQFSAFDGEEMEVEDDEHTGTRYLRIGDTIWFAKYGGVTFEFTYKADREDGKEYRMINDADVIAIIDDLDEILGEED
jgi:co-chaperonin GroES (HSP10)